MGGYPPQGTGAVPGDPMSLTPAERLIVQALLLSDATPFDGADIAAILADTATITWGDITGLVADMGVFPTANYATLAAYVEDMRNRVIAVTTDITEGKERRWKETYVYETEYEQIANAAEETVTPPTGISPAFPAGSTLRRAILVASLKANNDTAALHKIGVTLEYQIAGGGWNDLIDLTAVPVLMLPEVEGTGDAVSIVEDMTGLFTSGQLVEVRFSVDSTNAAAVNYMTTFVLSLEFDLV